MNLFESLSFRWHALFATQWWHDFSRKIARKEKPEWMVQRIKRDLSAFAQAGICKEMLDQTMQLTLAKDNLICVRYRIENNALSIPYPHRASCKRFEWITGALCALCKHAPLPDMEFIICLEDAIDHIDLPGPVLAFAKQVDSHKVILMPDMDALSPRIPKLLYDVKRGIKRYPWGKKQTQAFWRGATTGYVFTEKNFLDLPRARAVTASLSLPHLIDARFTKLVQTAEAKTIQQRYSAYFSTSCTVTEHLKYKYQLLIDGNTCAYSRAYWQFFSNCAIFKQNSDNIQWFYDLLEPYVHYIPLQQDMSDLEEKVTWAMQHEPDICAMVERTQQLAHCALKPADVYLYLYLLLLEYAKWYKTQSPNQNNSPKDNFQSGCGSLEQRANG